MEQETKDNLKAYAGAHVNQDWMKTLDYEEMRKIRRKYWTFVIWPDDSLDMNKSKCRLEFRNDLYDRLDEMVIPSLISPIHMYDLKEDGTKAKPHCHVVSFWENPQRYNVVMSILQNGCGLQNVKYIQPVANIRAMMRYLVHLDNPEKVQYDVRDVLEVAGAKYVIEDETASEMVIQYIIDNRIDKMTSLLQHFVPRPSCTKWIISNPGLVKALCREQADMTSHDYQSLRDMV